MNQTECEWSKKNWIEFDAYPQIKIKLCKLNPKADNIILDDVTEYGIKKEILLKVCQQEHQAP